MATKKAKKPVIAREPAAIREALLDDPNTEGIAKKLGVPLEEYVAQVIHFAMNPQEEPSLYVVEDEDLVKLGLPPPDEKAMGQYLVEAAAVANAAGATEFTDPKAKKVALTDQSAQDLETVDENLKKKLDQQLRGKRGGKG